MVEGVVGPFMEKADPQTGPLLVLRLALHFASPQSTAG